MDEHDWQKSRQTEEASRWKGPSLPAAPPLSHSNPGGIEESPCRSASPAKAKQPPTRTGSLAVAKKPRHDCRITDPRACRMNWLSGFVAHNWSAQLIPAHPAIRANECQRLRTIAKRMRNDSLTNWTISYRRLHIAFCKRIATFLFKRWKRCTKEKILCMLKKFFLPERFATFVNDHVTSPNACSAMENRLRTFTNVSPKIGKR